MRQLLIQLLSAISFTSYAQNANQENPEDLLATLRNDTLFIHTDAIEFAEYRSLTPKEIAYNKFNKINYFREKTIWFYYVVYDYGRFYVGTGKGGREIYQTTFGGRIKAVNRTPDFGTRPH